MIDGIAAALGGYFESAFDRRHRHGAIRQFLGDRGGIDRAGVRHADDDIDEHVA
jgi:hypothetical protein